MKGFERKMQLFSLCGLCPMLLENHCGCGNGNQLYKIAKCGLAHGKVDDCYECKYYPCEKYQHIDEYNSAFSLVCGHLHPLLFQLLRVSCAAFAVGGDKACINAADPAAGIHSVFQHLTRSALNLR